MDFLNQAYAQISELFRSMTVGARITAALLLAVVVVSLGYLFNQQASGPDDYLMGGKPIEASFLPAMEAAFSQAGLHDYKIDGSRISIPRGKSGVYMAALADGNALPSSFESYINDAIDKGGVFESREVRQQRIKSAKQQQLATIIRSMQDIQSAMVLYDEKQQPGIKRAKILTASVNVKPMGNRPLDASRVPALRNIVASAIAGLEANMVSVTDLNTGRNYATTSGDADAEATGLYPERKKYYERQWTQTFKNLLSMIPNSVVAVNVELTPETSSHMKQVEYDPKTVPRSSKSISLTETDEAGAPGGRPGAASQAPAIAGGPGAGGASIGSSTARKSTSEKIDETAFNVIGETIRETTTPGLQPKKVKVAIGIPNSYLRQVLKIQNPDQEITPDLLARAQTAKTTEITDMISPLVPRNDKQNVDDTRKDVTVTYFEDIVDDTPIEEPGAVSTTLGWFSQNLSTVSLSLLAVFGMVMLRSIVRASPSTPGSPAVAAAATEGGFADESSAILPFAPEANATEEERVEHEKKLKRRLSSGPSVKDELAELVKEDPDAAANILRTWISNAG